MTTCHWCHVMERESFEDETVAAALNQAFVCIKVDREERPDLDAYYMAVCQALTGSGGWPLNVFLTPDLQAFYAGTYFPKSTRQGRTGLLELAPAISRAWQEKRADLLETAREIEGHLATNSAAQPADSLPPGAEVLDLAERQLLRSYDRTYGGFGRAPKFPTPHNLLFLLRHWRQSGKHETLDAAVQTLLQLARGGICDQVGGGFHRYSTDREWLLPHFEKMLYDQAMLAIAYLEGYQATGKPELADQARAIFSYVLRDLTSPEGGFYSAEDADSEGVEGKFYVWSLSELRSLLGDQELALMQSVFGAKEQGNFHDEASGELSGANILHRTKPWSAAAQELQLTEAELQAIWASVQARLLVVRSQRVRPHLDDKILTDWNGLMIAALALGGRVLQEQAWTDAAMRATDFLLQRLLKSDGRLWKRYRQGEAALPAHLDDYAFTVWALLELHQTTQQPDYLAQAHALNRTMVSLFCDEEQGGFYLTAADQTELPVRLKETYDGAIPAGNSVATLNNLRLGLLLHDDSLSEVGKLSLQAAAQTLQTMPSAHTALLQALDFLIGGNQAVIVVGERGRADTETMLLALWRDYRPNQVVLLHSADRPDAFIGKLLPGIHDYQEKDGQSTAYVCSGNSCQPPTTEVAEMIRQLGAPSFD